METSVWKKGDNDNDRNENTFKLRKVIIYN